MSLFPRLRLVATAAIAAAFLAPAPARAQLILSELVVELDPANGTRHDIEVQNNGAEILYVSVGAREVFGSGTPQISSREEPDPEKLGLLVSPGRMVLDSGKRKLLRVASLAQPSERERVYRVTVKPVVGQLSTESAGLKILLGYEVLVLVRPIAPQVQITGTRAANSLTLRNSGNASVEMMSGKQCDESGKNCQQLPGGRLYAGAEKVISINPGRSVAYTFKQGTKLISKQY